MLRSRTTLLAGAAAVILLACEQFPDASDARPYEACDFASLGEPCGDGPTACESASYARASGYCSQSCEVDVDCIPAEGFDRPECVQFFEGRMCAIPCGPGGACPSETVCTELERFDGHAKLVCLPKEAS